jgi:hypothetical protein
VAGLGRLSRRDAERAGPLLRVLDGHTRPLVHQASADEMFAGRRPVLMLVEPASLCWVSGQLEAHRDGPTWARHFGRLRAVEQVTRDGGTGMQKGLEQHERRRARSRCSTVDDRVGRRRAGRARLLQLAFAAGLRQCCTDITRFSHGASSGGKPYQSSFISGGWTTSAWFSGGCPPGERATPGASSPRRARDPPGTSYPLAACD